MQTFRRFISIEQQYTSYSSVLQSGPSGMPKRFG